MKNINENELKNYIFKKLQESYFDEMEFDNEAMKAAMSDMENSGEEFEELGASKFEKSPKFKEKFKSALNRANLELPSDEEEVERLAQMVKSRNDHEGRFGKGSLNETDVEHIKDANGKPIKLKSPVQHESGVNGYVERFMVGDDKNMLVKVTWIQSPNVDKLNPIVSPEKLIVKENMMEINEEAYEESRYMFFSNLEQIRRQAGLLLDLDENKINEILENGHDWAQDHIATAKESIDQVFDFLMNETQSDDMLDSNNVEHTEGEEEIEEGMGRSFTVGMNKNEKPEDYPEELMREAVKSMIKEALTESFMKEDAYHKLSFLDKIKLKLAGVSEDQAIENLNNGLPMDWKGSKEGFYDNQEPRGNYSGTNEGLEEDMDKTDYDFNQAGLEHEREEEARKELGDELYYVLDDEFNNANYPDLVGKTFPEKPADGVNIKKMGGEVDESSSDSLLNKHGQNAKPNASYLQEGVDNDRYEQIVFLQDHEADHALNILMQDGEDEAMDYLMQWHQSGNHETSEEVGFGSSDKTYERDGYTMAWNPSLGYISLVHDLNSSMDEDSQRKRHSAGQIEKASKGVSLGQNAPHSDSAKGL
jgi:hypothetical protein